MTLAFHVPENGNRHRVGFWNLFRVSSLKYVVNSLGTCSDTNEHDPNHMINCPRPKGKSMLPSTSSNSNEKAGMEYAWQTRAQVVLDLPKANQIVP